MPLEGSRRDYNTTEHVTRSSEGGESEGNQSILLSRSTVEHQNQR